MFIDLYIFNTNIKITHGCDSNYLVVVSSGRERRRNGQRRIIVEL